MSITLKDLQDYIDLVNQQEPVQFSGIYGGDFLRDYHKKVGDKMFKATMKNANIMTNKDGMDFLKSLGI